MKKYIFFTLILMSSFFLLSMSPISGILHMPQTTEDSDITNTDFLNAYYRTIENSLNINPRVGKLGTATVEGLKSGSFHYKGKLGFFKVRIEMTYDDYCDYDVVLNGKATVECNLAATGKMTGEFNINGPVAGNIIMDLDLIRGEETNGYYYVAQDGKASEIFDYTAVQEKSNRTFTIETQD